MDKEVELLKRKIKREVMARKEAERILEAKALELYDVNIKLTEMNVNLEDTVQRRTEALKEAKLVAEKAQQAEQQFLASMSHEIRTPLNAVIGMSHLLYDTNPSEEQLEYLDNLKSSAKLLHSLISDILDFTKIQSGKIEIQFNPFNLVQTVLEIQKTFELKLDGRPIKIKSEIDPRIENLVVGDELLLHQVLFNLIGNADKFTNNGIIHIDVKVLALVKNYISIQFKISDTGIGIPMDKIATIFESFKQAANNKHKDHRSTGLGLSITKKLIELQGGTIDVESEEGKGTCFTFVLGYEYSEAKNIDQNEPKTISASGTDFSHLKVLIAEDNSMNRKYIKRVFEKWNLDYEMAFNGKEALDKSYDKKYDLILMDIQMPEMDGIESAKFIRKSRNLNHETIIIALTASALTQHRSLAIDAGMNDFITKPFTPNQLLVAFSKFFSAKPAASDKTVETPKAKAVEPVVVEAVIPEEEIQFETYHPKLDKNYLDTIYGTDWEYAADMFETFLEEIHPLFADLPPLAEAESWEQYYKVAHKVKPSLLMVGLSDIHKKVKEVEGMAAGDTPDKALMITNTSTIINDLKVFVPIIKQQLTFLQNKMVNQ